MVEIIIILSANKVNKVKAAIRINDENYGFWLLFCSGFEHKCGYVALVFLLLILYIVSMAL